MVTVGVIPARYASTRLPAKPLLRETGKFLIQHVYERARAARRLDRLIVATDDARIAEAVRSFGGEAVMTSPDLPSGSARAAAAIAGLSADRVLNIQGDEPEVDPAHIDIVAQAIEAAEMTTLAAPFPPNVDPADPNRVKVVIDRAGFALYFSRAPIPHGSAPKVVHAGLYGFRRETLLRFAALPPTPLEISEHLEQLRALEHGMRIRVDIVDAVLHGGIDTPEDYRNFVQRWKKNS